MRRWLSMLLYTVLSVGTAVSIYFEVPIVSIAFLVCMAVLNGYVYWVFMEKEDGIIVISGDDTVERIDVDEKIDLELKSSITLRVVRRD